MKSLAMYLGFNLLLAALLYGFEAPDAGGVLILSLCITGFVAYMVGD